MEKIADRSELEHVMGLIREDANCLPESKDSLVRLLGMLIADALAEFTGEKFDMPRRSGDLDDADGINHLLTDYPSWVYPSGMRAAFLTIEEESAALLLRKLYLARDFLELGFGLSEETIREIEETEKTLLLWRQSGQIHTLQPLAQRGQAELDRLADMRIKATGESTIYSEQDKESWRSHDSDQTREAARKLNQADRIRSILKKFNLPGSAYRTVSRALFGR